MAVCIQCGKNVFFGHLNKDHLCAKCVEKNEAEARAAEEAARESEYIEEIYAERDRTDEISACRFFIDEFCKQGKGGDKFKIRHTTNEYTSLQYAMTEILRIRMTDHVKWIAIALDAQGREKHWDDPIFEWQTDKSQKFWKSYFKGFADLFRYEDAVLGIPLVDYYGIGRELTEVEILAAKRIYDLFLECGAEPDNFYIYELSNAFELVYCSLNGRVRVRMAGEGLRGSIVDSIIGGGEFGFTDLGDLDEMKDAYIPYKIRGGEEVEMDMHRYRKFERNEI